MSTLGRFMNKFVISGKTYSDDVVAEFKGKLEKILVDVTPANAHRENYKYAHDVSVVIEVIDD